MLSSSASERDFYNFLIGIASDNLEALHRNDIALN